jgi:16S rRNA A1518/A1519 N6-dimethyltransferase RsmA/KsgA/DIM1 with predicted DNA glycosylase/AP lyase activity
MQTFTSIPFKTDSGMSTINGVAKFSRAGVVLEFESKLFGLITAGVKEVRLPVEEILDVKFRKGVFKRGARIEVRLKSFAKLTTLPYKEGKLTLKLERDDFERADEAVANLQKEMAERAAAVPPTHTPVSVLFDESEEETRDLRDPNK